MLLLCFSTPAFASLSITDRQTASTALTTGPQFYTFDSGTDLLAGSSTSWAGFTLEGTEVDPDTGQLILGRAGDVAPSAIAWHDEPSTTRACEADPAQSVRSLTFDVQREIDAGRMQSDLSDVRVHDVTDGTAVPFRTGSPDATSIVVDTTDLAEAASVCVYWGATGVTSLSDASVQGPVVPDGGWSWSTWLGTGDGLSLDLVDWSSPSATGTVPSGAVPADVCNQCANELVGFVTPAVDGSYVFAISADDVGRLELSPTADPAGLATVVELASATPAGDFSDPAQVAVAVDLVAGETYAIRARSKDLEDGDHLEIAWSVDGGPMEILPTEVISSEAGDPGVLTHRRFDVVATVDRSAVPDSTVRVEASEITADSCDDCAHRLSGYVVIEETGAYRFWISSDDEGELWLATDGSPTSASRVAWLTNFADPSDWTADPSQRSAAVELEAGQTIWLEALSRDRGGPDHLQVGISRDDTEPATSPDLIPAESLSENAPVEAPLPVAALGSIEGQQAPSGSFVSPAIDSTPGGSNVFGRLRLDGAGPVTVEVSFAADPAGPWSDPVSVVNGVAAPLAADGLRYLRFTGTLTAIAESADPTVDVVGVARDLTEATSSDGTTSITAATGADQAVLRVRGSIGAGAMAQIGTSSNGAVAFTLADPSADGVTEVPFGSVSHHVVVSATPGADSASVRWSATDGRGAVVVHDIVVSLSS